MTNTARFKVSGREVTVNFDLDAMRGDVLETLEEHLGGDSVYVWLKRWVDALEQGVRISEFRTRDLIGLVFLGTAQANVETTWQSVSRSISPYTLEFLPTEEAPAAKPITVGVAADLGQQVPMPDAATALNLAAIGVPAPGAHEAPGEIPAEAYYQTRTP